MESYFDERAAARLTRIIDLVALLDIGALIVAAAALATAVLSP